MTHIFKRASVQRRSWSKSAGKDIQQKKERKERLTFCSRCCFQRPVFPPELTDTKTARPFSFSFNTSDYRILLMDQDQGRLYLGSREYLVALDMHNVNKEPLIVGRIILTLTQP